MINTSEWLSLPALWGNTTANLEAFADNGLDGWNLQYDGSSSFVSGRRRWRFTFPRLSTQSGLVVSSGVRPPQTISVNDVVEGNPISTHFCFDLAWVAVDPSGGNSQALHFGFVMSKVSSSAYSSANGNGAQPDFDFRIYGQSTGDLWASGTGVIATTGLPSGWAVSSPAPQWIFRGGIGNAFARAQNSIQHNWPASFGVSPSSWTGGLVVAWRLRDPVHPYYLDQSVTTTQYLNDGIYQAGLDYTDSASDSLAYAQAVQDRTGMRYTGSGSDALSFDSSVLARLGERQVWSGTDRLRMRALVASVVRSGAGVEVNDDLRMLQSIQHSNASGDAVTGAHLALTESFQVESTVRGISSSGFIPVM